MLDYDSATLYLDVLLREYELVVEKKTGLEQRTGMLLAGAFVVLGMIFDKVRLTEGVAEAVNAIRCKGNLVTWIVLSYVTRVVVGTLAYVVLAVAMWRMCKVIDKSVYAGIAVRRVKNTSHKKPMQFPRPWATRL